MPTWRLCFPSHQPIHVNAFSFLPGPSPGPSNSSGGSLKPQAPGCSSVDVGAEGQRGLQEGQGLGRDTRGGQGLPEREGAETARAASGSPRASRLQVGGRG